MKCLSPWYVDDALRPLNNTTERRTDSQWTGTSDPGRQHTTRQHAKELTTITSIAGTTVSMTITAKRVQGSIWAPELDELDIEILKKGFSTQGVTVVYRPPRGSRALLVLTFEGSTLPQRVTAGYLSYEVRVVIPRPRRCTKCQKYGHSEAKCRAAHACGQCAGAHATNTCQAQQPRSAACEGDRAVSDANCPRWKLEQQVLKHIHRDGMDPKEARAKVERQFGVQSPTPRRRLAENPPGRGSQGLSASGELGHV